MGDARSRPRTHHASHPAEEIIIVSDAEIAATLVGALSEAAAIEAGAPVRLLSVEVMMVAPGRGVAEARVLRKTKSLLFMEAELKSPSGERIAIAESVHSLPA